MRLSESQQPLSIAVDLGAGSGRVFLCGFGPGELLLEEVRRFRYVPGLEAGHLRWDFARMRAEIEAGLLDAARRANALGRSVRTIGVDSWAVDYGLVDDTGRLIENPICYRDSRTEHTMPAVFARVPAEEIFARTGIQFLPFNTIFQLFAHAAEGLPRQAARLLLIPDLVNAALTGRAAAEWTNATTTQLVNSETSEWDDELMARLELPRGLLPDLIQPGTTVGPLTTDLAAQFGAEPVTVVAPATHDTASAVVGAPIREGWAYISSGTWSLVGLERSQPIINADAIRANVTNEGGAFGTTRLLKNVMGLWILESCRGEWERAGGSIDYDTLLAAVGHIDTPRGVIFPDDPRFLNPLSMDEAIRVQMMETGQEPPRDPAAVARVVLDSLALRYASVVRSLETLTGERIRGIQIVGGGSRNAYLNRATANATRLPVMAGPVEATVIGNAAVQAIASGRFASLQDARAHVAANVDVRTFTPERTSSWNDLAERYAEIEAQYAVGPG
jgi:rhamnulokinase